MEMMDVYNEDFVKTGKVVERDRKNLSLGERFLMVDIFLYNDNKFLIQKRADVKKWNPGIWDITGGAVSSGENSIDAAIREVWEELGIILNKNDLVLMTHMKTPTSYVDIYIAKVKATIDDITCQTEEVSEVKYVSKEELIAMILSSYHRESYKEFVVKYLNENF